jgi:hypothetical protein
VTVAAQEHHPQGGRPSSADSTYVSGERVFGPPRGTFDVEWVAREVDRVTDVGYATAHDWVAAAWRQARSTGSLAEDNVRAAVLEIGGNPASADVVARHVVAYCTAYEVHLGS